MSWENKINKETIVEDYKKRFSTILEYTFREINEADDDATEEDTEDPAEGEDGDEMGGEMPPMDNQATSMDGQMGGENTDMENEMPPMDDQMPNDNGEMGGDDLTAGFNPDETAMDDTTSQMQPDDEVVDITELTDAQEETKDEIEQFDAKFVSAIKAIKSIEDMLNNNNAKIADLEKELKRRNPTPMEKMNNRATISYPFNVSPTDYWDDKEKNSNYSTDSDNNGKGQEQYEITVGDINNSNNWKEIYDSLDDDFIYNQSLDKIMKM